jgi:hypothetical protein
MQYQNERSYLIVGKTLLAPAAILTPCFRWDGGWDVGKVGFQAHFGDRHRSCCCLHKRLIFILYDSKTLLSCVMDAKGV